MMLKKLYMVQNYDGWSKSEPQKNPKTQKMIDKPEIDVKRIFALTTTSLHSHQASNRFFIVIK